MTKSWDSHLKLLAKTVPQDLVSWLLKGAIYEDEVSPHLNARNIDADILYRVRINNRLCLLHIEFQVKADARMAERLWEYNTLQVIKLWEVPTQQLKDLGLKGLLPLLPLTHEGKRQEVVEEMIVALCEGEREERSELLSLAYALSSLLFRSQDEQQWLKWRFGMLDDLLEESWALQEILQRGVKQGIEQGAEQAREQALVLSRHTVLALVEHHASSLLPMARAKIERTTDLAALQDLILQVSLASCESEVRARLE